MSNNKKQLDTKRLVTLSALIAVAMILSYIESMIPAFVAVPGVKVGLSNIATVFALYALGWPYAIIVSVIRVLLSALLFGNAVSLIYSLSGAALALLSMILLKKLDKLSSVGISVVGGVCHNIGQVIAACLVMETAAISFYIIPLTISGTIAGIVIGLVAGNLVERVKKYI
ncbi:MAG: Gx transporter family protein [Clostridia bacterium]|nr:Gx transporter family protein [Clostridia bacterium]MBR3876275.1 Gx transporter family protein [Clostridia bacterium]